MKAFLNSSIKTKELFKVKYSQKWRVFDSLCLYLFQGHGYFPIAWIEGDTAISDESYWMAYKILTTLPPEILLISPSRAFDVNYNQLCTLPDSIEVWIDIYQGGYQIDTNWRETQRLDSTYFCDGTDTKKTIAWYISGSKGGYAPTPTSTPKNGTSPPSSSQAFWYHFAWEQQMCWLHAKSAFGNFPPRAYSSQRIDPQ